MDDEGYGIAEERASGTVNLTSTTLELVTDTSVQKVGVRFAGLDIPAGAIIQNAWIQFTANSVTTDATSLTVQAEASDNAPTFTTVTSSISTRTKTAAAVAWTPASWNNADEGGPEQRTPDLASVVQEVVDRPGWAEGNAMAFLITGSGKRVAKSYERDLNGAPYLHVEYSLPEPTPTPSPTPTNTPIVTPTPIRTPVPTGPFTIQYTYDALRRLTGASYSDGRSFGYTYDSAGNVLELQQNLGPGTVTTTYTYDAANQLATAQQGSVTTQYTYDENGSLISGGVKTYAYDFANRLIEVSDQTSVTSLTYNGLGQRLSMTAAGITTQYVMDGDQPLTANSSGNTTFYLYGVGVIGEKNTTWSYSLPDGTNTPRQLTDLSGGISLSGRYTPWGDSLETYGDGGFAFGYFRGLMDGTTGLLYVGNGQYYDPTTGRFLTRDAKPDSGNPYVPWDPSGALIAPLGLLAAYYSRKRKGGKWGMWIALLLMLATASMTLAACGPGGGSGSTPAPTVPPGETPTPVGPGTSGAGTPPAPGAASQTTTIPCPTPPTPMPTGTPPIRSDEDWDGIVNVLWYEGASHFAGDQTQIVFRQTLWALWSEGKYDPVLYGWTYSQIVQSERYSARGHFIDQDHPWPSYFVGIAQAILSDQLSPLSPFANEAIYFISATHFLRRAPQDLNGGTPFQGIRSQQIQNCSTDWCAFPDVRWRNRLFATSLDRAERFINLPADSYQLEFKEHFQNQYQECYWIGLYFNNEENHINLFNEGNNYFFPAPTYSPDSEQAKELRCPSNPN